jgi:hypothetical protein
MNCCLSEAEDGVLEFASTIERRARKPHRCCECRETISPGQRYVIHVGIWDWEWSRYKQCIECDEIQRHFACTSYIYGELWPDLREIFFPTMVAGGPCMDGLSAAAKGKMFAMWRKWKGLEVAQ